MADAGEGAVGPDLGSEGVPQADLADGGMALGHVGDTAVLLVRQGDEVFAIGAECSHYGGPLAEGVFDGACVRCPWHHAAFDVRTGAAERAPALNPVATYHVEARNGRWHVTGEVDRAPAAAPIASAPASVVIVGAGAAGAAAAETLRREGYEGPITMLGAEGSDPPDRPNLSKDYLAGSAPEEWVWLRDGDFYRDQRVELRPDAPVASIDAASQHVVLRDGERLPYGALLLATGAEPVRLDIPGADLPHVFTLRSFADSHEIVAAAEHARRAVVIGASFIGLEVAAALRERDLEVHVVAPETVPLERVLGAPFGPFLRAIHEEHGVAFHLGHTAAAIAEGAVALDDGTRLDADLVVMGVGVRPRTGLAEAAGLRVDGGIVVDAELRTSAPAVWAAGDVARWPDPRSGESVRVEHWVVAERQGAAAARNMLGRAAPYDDVPFFWSQHYDVPINYVGHAPAWDEIAVSGDAQERDVVVAYRRGGRTLGVASIYRDDASLAAELAMERGDEAALRGLVE